VPLVTDLDGTLVATDILFEGALSVFRRTPWVLPQFAVWCCRGRAVLQAEIAARCALDASNLSYRREIVEYLRAERIDGRRIVLASAAHRFTADAVAEYLGLFDLVLATSGFVNLKGARKRDELIIRFGARGFDYIGDSRADTPVWAACRVGYIVGRMRRLPDSSLAARALQGRTFSFPAPKAKTWLRAIRIHQWTKNLLVS